MHGLSPAATVLRGGCEPAWRGPAASRRSRSGVRGRGRPEPAV